MSRGPGITRWGALLGACVVFASTGLLDAVDAQAGAKALPPPPPASTVVDPPTGDARPVPAPMAGVDLPPPAWSSRAAAGPVVDVSDATTAARRVANAGRGRELRMVTAKAGVTLLLRSHHALGLSGFASGDEATAPFPALTAELDLHPGAISDSHAAGSAGLRARYTHRLTPSPGSSDTSPGKLATGSAVGHREFVADLHAELGMGRRYLPILEPMLGFALLDLRTGANPVDLAALRYTGLFAGLRIHQPLVAKRLALSFGASYRMAVSVGADSMDAYQHAVLPAGHGFDIDAGVSVHPVSWLELTAGWRLQRMHATLWRLGATGNEKINVADTVNGFHFAAAVHAP